MLMQLFTAWVLMATCIVIHAAGSSAALRWLPQDQSSYATFNRRTWHFITIAGWMILLHLAEIGVWAMLFLWQGAIPDLASSLYFSAVTYTTTGYGDVVLPQAWRLVGGVEALTGILMCGWSTAFFIAVVNRTFSRG